MFAILCENRQDPRIWAKSSHLGPPERYSQQRCEWILPDSSLGASPAVDLAAFDQGFEHNSYFSDHLTGFLPARSAADQTRLIRGFWRPHVAYEVPAVVELGFHRTKENFMDQVTMGIDERDAAALFQVLPEQRCKQRRFSRARLPDHIHVVASVLLPDAEALALGLREQRNRVIVVHAPMIAAQRPFAETAYPAALA